MNKEIQFVSPFKNFCITIGNLPTAYLESMSYYESLTFLVNFLEREVIPTVNNNSEVVSELQLKFTELKNYVDNYFENLDVQEEINNKLDEMVEDGTLQEMINQFLESTALWTFDTVDDMKNADNLINGSYAKTLGYYSLNDNGGAVYKITDQLPLTYCETLDSGLYAVLILSDNVNVKQFGAKGDGITNDTLKIQTAINNCYNKLTIPEGEYLVSQIVIDKSMKFVGTNSNTSIIKSINSNTSDSVIKIENSGLARGEICNITIDGNKSNNSNNINGLILVSDTVADRYTFIHDLKVVNCTANGIYIKRTIGNNDTKEIRLNNIQIGYCNENGLFVESSSDSYFFEISSYRNKKHGFLINGGNHKIINCKAFWNGEGISGEYEDINRLPDQAFTETTDVVYDSSKTYYIKNDLIYEEFTGTVFVEGTTYYELTTLYQKRYAGFRLNGARNIITGCESQENFGDGFYTYASNLGLVNILGDNNGILIDNENNLISYASVGLEQLYYGIYIRSGRKINVIGNFFNSRVDTIGKLQKAPLFAINHNYLSYNILSDENVIDDVLIQGGNHYTINGVCNNKEFVYNCDLSNITLQENTLSFYGLGTDNTSYVKKIGNKVLFNLRINDTSGNILPDTNVRRLFYLPAEVRPSETNVFMASLTNNSGAQLNQLANMTIYKTGGVDIRVNVAPQTNLKGVFCSGSYIINP